MSRFYSFFCACLLSFDILFSRAITLDSIASYDTFYVPNSLPMSDEVLQFDIARIQEDLDAKRRRIDAGKLASVPGGAETLTDAITEEEGKLQDLQLERLILRLQSSKNPRISETTETYRQILSDINAFETAYFKRNIAPNFEDDFISRVGKFDTLPEEDRFAILDTVRNVLRKIHDVNNQAELYEMAYETKLDETKEEALLDFFNVKLKSFRNNIYFDGSKASWGDTYDVIWSVLGKDILFSYVRDILAQQKSEDIDVLQRYTVTPNDWRFSFHTFTPRSWQEGVSNSSWKMHVSGVNMSAWYIFKYVLPYLMHNNRYFKVYKSIQELHNFYYGGFLPQAGKLITIYPRDDTESQELAQDLNDLMLLLGVKESQVVPVPNDVKVGLASGVYGRYEGHSTNAYYDRMVPWGDDLNADRDAKCPFVQEGIDVRWEKDGKVLVPSWQQRPSTWAKISELEEDLQYYKRYLNEEGKADAVLMP